MAWKLYEIYTKDILNYEKKLKNWLFLKACEIPHLLMTSLTNISSQKKKKIANNIINKKKTEIKEERR